METTVFAGQSWKTALRMHVDMIFCEICECIVSFCKSGTPTEIDKFYAYRTPPIQLITSAFLALRIVFCLWFTFIQLLSYIQSLIILPLMTSSLYLIFIAHHGKLPVFELLSSSLFRCHVELWCTNRSLFCVIFFFALTLFFVNVSVDGKGKIS